MFDNLAHAERIEIARARMKRVVDHLLFVVEIHENNSLIVYSPTLSSQIPTSYAAHAFKVFQNSMHLFELVRLCALWDQTADADKETLPAVVELVDHPEIIETLALEAGSWWDGEAALMNPTRDPDLIEAEREAIRQTERLFGLSQAQRATRREKSGEVSPLKYGQETELLSQTIPIVEALYLWVNGTSFQIDTSRQFANENAHALWQGCKFSVLE